MDEVELVEARELAISAYPVLYAALLRQSKEEEEKDA